MGRDTCIGSYRLIDQLGEGGMGVVWLAQHTLLGRQAAIKILLPTCSVRGELVQRFFNEARAAAAIGDPGIVQIFDFGIQSDGSAYIVMELLAGESLADRIKRSGGLSIREALTLIRQIVMSLSAAHAKHVVHRDLKPENVFIVSDPAVPGGERTKVLDFGIAKLSTYDNALKTQTGAWLGTPVYASPEQCRSLADVDQRSDIYSLGCMLYCMLAGRPPFEADSAGDFVAAHVRDPAPSVALLVPNVPRALDAVIARCMEKNPGDRFESMDDLFDALATIDLRHAAVPVSGPSAPTVAMRQATTLSSATGHRIEHSPASRRRSTTFVTYCALAIALVTASAFFTTELLPVEEIIPAATTTPTTPATTETAPPIANEPPRESQPPQAPAQDTPTTSPPHVPSIAATTNSVDELAPATNAPPLNKKRKAPPRRSKQLKQEAPTRVEDTAKSGDGYVDRDD